MAYTSVWITSFLLRLVLPLILAGCIVFRPCGLSFLYLLLFLYIPVVPVPTVQSFKGHTGRFLRVAVFISFLTVILQIVFQIVLLSLAPYGSFLINCEFLEQFFRHIGLIKINYLKWIQLLRWLGPDVIALAGTLITYITISNILIEDTPSCEPNTTTTTTTTPITKLSRKLIQKNSSPGNKILSTIGPYLVLALLCITSSFQPSLPSSIYYIIFLFGATCWALCINIKSKIFAGIFIITCILAFVHIIILFLYQLQWAQELIPSDSLAARLSGLVPIFLTNCEFDPRDMEFNPNLSWPSFVQPGVLLTLFHLLIYEIKTLLSPQEKIGFGGGVLDARAQLMSRGRVGSLTCSGIGVGGDDNTSRLSRRQTVRWQGKSSRRDWKQISSLVGSITNLAYISSTPRGSVHIVHNESTPLMTFAAPRTRYSTSSGGGRSFSGDGSTSLQLTSKETALLSRGQSITSKESGGMVPGSSQQSPMDGKEEGYQYDGYGLLLAGLFSIFEIFAKSSYVATNIIMMAWSITYHSWLTFVLLIWACVLWMFPNQRKAMLYSSPGLVFYAELLLIAQYIYSLNLTDSELPKTIDDINLEQVGLIKTQIFAYKPILIKSLYTVMFWITLKQFVMERRVKKSSIEEAAHEPFRITVSTTTAGPPISELRQIKEEEKKKPNYMMKIGTFVKALMTKFWIWVVAVMLFIIGLGGEKVVLYRIVYMALFLVFILTFQLSYNLWRKMMYGFWLTVIIYSMFVLVMIYTYQFKNVPEFLSNYTGIPYQLQKDIGLEIYDTGSLFVRLLAPTFFVIITVVQLHYFHKDFLKLSDISSGQERIRDISPIKSIEEEEPPPALIDEFNVTNLMKNISYYGTKLLDYISKIYSIASKFAWRFLDIHITKIVLFSAFMLAVNDTCALHFILFAGIICAMAVSSTRIQRLICHLCSIYISVLLLVKMIYQIDYIKHDEWITNCTIQNKNVTRNDAEWLGLKKVGLGMLIPTLPILLRGYIGMIFVLTVQAVVRIRQRYQHRITSENEPIIGILFPGIYRQQADKDLPNCIKYLFNYCFYKFGVEFTLITMVIVIGTRLDVFSVLYSFWLIPMFYMRRQKLSTIWLPFIAFVAVLLPIQYLACVGLPPILCAEYPWESWTHFGEELNVWLFLPDVTNPPMASRLISDFFLLLFACQQQIVFWVEKNTRPEEFPGGSNHELTDSYIHPIENPIPDFLTISRTWLDVIKKCLFLSFYWITLAIIFLAGTNRVNLFALGYLIGSFIFLWEGNEFYLRSKRNIYKRWNWLLAYNVFVVFSKSILQLVGCVFASVLQYNFCWVVQLFGIACLKFQNKVPVPQGSHTDVCPIPHGEAGLMWDGITFAFLIIQRRIFNSYYFFHIISETEAQAQLASRGAELIGNLMHKQIQQQEEQEKDVLEKIKMKMDRIKATHQKGGATKEINNHYDASSMVSSQMSDDPPPIEIELKPPPSPLAPLAVPICTGITTDSGPTPTPSSAAMTLSVDGFFEPPYGHHRRDSLLHPPILPLSPSDESFPVFSPPPYNDDDDPRIIHHHRDHRRGVVEGRHAGVQTSPPQQKQQQLSMQKEYYNYPLQSPALSHHTSIRSGDYYMFDEYDDDDMEMIDSITEEEDEDGEHDRDRPYGVTVSELMASALKTGDVESATEMARLARQGSEMKEGSLTESTAGTSSVALTKRRKSKRMSRKSFSFKSDRQRVGGGGGRRIGGDQDLTTAPLASDGEGTSSADPYGRGGGGRDGRHPSTSTGGFGGSMDGDGDDGEDEGRGRPEELPPPPPPPTFMRRLLGYLRFAWAFLESVMISLTAYLNKLSKDYRHVAWCLSTEKLLLKERELGQPFVTTTRAGAGASAEIVDYKDRKPRLSIEQAIEPLIDTRIDLTKQTSTEESDLGGSGDVGSKDDLLTVVEKPSPTKEKEDIIFEDEGSLDEISISEVSGKVYPPIVQLLTALWYVIISHSDLLCYFVIFINQINSASILSLPLPLMVLLWGSLSVPRPTKTFWVTIIAYTEAIVVIKYLFQFDFFNWDDKITKGPFSPPKILGVEKDARYAMFDVPLLMVVFFHRFMLKSLGLWKNKSNADDEGEGEGGSIYISDEKEPMNVKIKDDSLNLSGHGDGSGDGVHSTLGSSDEQQSIGCAPHWDQQQFQESLTYAPAVLKLCFLQYLSSIKVFFGQILNAEYKVKVDVYSFMFMCDFFNFLVLIFGFASFGSSSGGDVASVLEDNKVPIPFLVMVILQFALIIIDRALYLRKYILGKFFFQIILVTLVHIAMFFLLPAFTERDFNAALPPQIWYMVKCIYLLFSAYQIRSGYPTRILGNFLCKKYNYVNMFLFKGFMLIPFLFELRALMDWIWTDTSMTLSDWLKLEDIFAHIFQLKCQRRVEKEYPQGRGLPKARWSKYAIGGSSLFIIIAIIWFPLVLFALGNTVGVISRPNELSIELSIGSYEPIFIMSAQNDSLKTFNARDWDVMNKDFRNDKRAIGFLDNYDFEDVSIAELNGNSGTVWGISPPAKNNLVLDLNSTKPVTVRLEWKIVRDSTQPTGPVKSKHEIELHSGSDTRTKLMNMINGSVDDTVILDGIFPKFLKVWAGKSAPPTELSFNRPPNQFLYRNLSVTLKNGTVQEWWNVEEMCALGIAKDFLPHDTCDTSVLHLFTFNEKAFPSSLSFLSGGGIIGLYTTLVLVASKFVRGFFTGISFLIMFDDMPNVDRIFQLCLDIYLVRESKELALEEDLFAKLIFLYRSPETLIKWTRPKRIPNQNGGEPIEGEGPRAIQQ